MNNPSVTLAQAKIEAQELNTLLRSIGESIDPDWLSKPKDNITAIRDKFKEINNEIKFASSELSSLNSQLKANLAELIKGRNYQIEANRIQRSLVSLSEQLKNDQYEINVLNQKQLTQLKSKVELERKALIDNIRDLEIERSAFAIATDEYNLRTKQIDTLKDTLNLSQELLDTSSQRLIFEQKVQNSLGITNDLVSGLQETFKSLGFGRLSEQLGIDDAIQKSEEFAKKLIEAKRKARETQGYTDNDGISVTGLDRLKTGADLLKNLGSNLMKSLGPLTILAGILDALKDADKDIGNIAKGFGTSYENATKIRSELTNISTTSNNVFATTANLSEAQLNLNNALGTTAQLSGETLLNYVELTKQAGYSVETAATLFKLSKLTNGSEQDLTETYLGQIKALNLQNKLQINGKALLDSISNVSKATLVSTRYSFVVMILRIVIVETFL